MSRIDIRDKDPFANTEDSPKDNVSATGFLTRVILRFGFYRLFWFTIGAIFTKLLVDRSGFSLDSFIGGLI